MQRHPPSTSAVWAEPQGSSHRTDSSQGAPWQTPARLAALEDAAVHLSVGVCLSLGCKVVCLDCELGLSLSMAVSFMLQVLGFYCYSIVGLVDLCRSCMSVSLVRKESPTCDLHALEQ